MSGAWHQTWLVAPRPRDWPGPVPGVARRQMRCFCSSPRLVGAGPAPGTGPVCAGRARDRSAQAGLGALECRLATAERDLGVGDVRRDLGLLAGQALLALGYIALAE